MTTPNDITRCTGRISGHPLGQVGNVRVTSGMGHVECVRCARREAAPPDAVVPAMEPPQFVGGKCPMRLTKIY